MPDAQAWERWLDNHGSFAFQGRNGRLNLLKEQRKAGLGYWYAYRRQSGRVAKRYAGTAAISHGRIWKPSRWHLVVVAKPHLFPNHQLR